MSHIKDRCFPRRVVQRAPSIPSALANSSIAHVRVVPSGLAVMPRSRFSFFLLLGFSFLALNFILSILFFFVKGYCSQLVQVLCFLRHDTRNATRPFSNILRHRTLYIKAAPDETSGNAADQRQARTENLAQD